MAAAKTAIIEFQDTLEAGPHLGRTLERMTDFRHTPETATLLEQAFGNPRPWQLEQLGGKPGAQQFFRVTVPAMRYALDPTTTLSWRDFATAITVDKTGRRLAYRGLWPGLTHEGSDLRVAMHNLRLGGDQRLGQGKLWFGTAQVDIERVDFFSGKAGSETSLTLGGIGFTSRVDELPTTIALAQRFHVATITAGPDEIKNLTVAYRFDRLDKKTAGALMAFDRRSDTAPDAVSRVVALFRQIARSASGAQSALVIERVSAEYAGHRFLISGRIALKGVRESDLDDPRLLVKRVDARFDVTLPVALLKAGSLAAARRELAASGKPEADAAALAQTMTDVALGKLLGDGYARLDKGVLRATIVVRNGVVRINGKRVELPEPAAPPPPPAPPPLTMPARQITGSCPLPDYPAAVVEQDAPLTLTLRVLVDETGTPGQTTVSAPSAWPDYDAQVLAAYGACRYIPALQGIAPVAQPLTVTIAREPGSVRP